MENPTDWRGFLLASGFVVDCKKILIDYRPNKFIRISLTPLYTSFEDIYNLTQRLFDIVKHKEYMNHDNEKPTVT